MTAAHEAPLTLTAEEASIRQSVRTWLLVSFVLFLLTIGAWIGFTTIGGIFFTISDAVALLLGVAMLPVAVGLDTLFRPDQPGLAKPTRWVGLTSMVMIAVGSIVILTSEVSHEFVPAGGGLGMQILGFALMGVWLLMIGILSGRTDVFSRRSELAAKAVAFGFLLGSLGSPFGPDNIVVYLGGMVGLIAWIVWAMSSRADLDGP